MITAHIVEYYLLFKKDKNVSDLDNFCNEIVNAYIEYFKKKYSIELESAIIDDIYKSEFNSINIYDETTIYKYIINNLNNNYKFHLFSSLNLDSIKEFGIDPNKKRMK